MLAYQWRPVIKGYLLYILLLTEDPYYSKDEDYEPGKRWGYCSICNIPLKSETQAYDHISGALHLSKEQALGLNPHTTGRTAPEARSPNTVENRSWEGGAKLYENGFDKHGNRRIEGMFKGKKEMVSSTAKLHSYNILDRKRHLSNKTEGQEFKRRNTGGMVSEGKTIGDELAELSDEDENIDNPDGTETGLEKNQNYSKTGTSSSKAFDGTRVKVIWIVATEDMKGVEKLDPQLGLKGGNKTICWHCVDGLLIKDVLEATKTMKQKHPAPDALILHVGRNDIVSLSKREFMDNAVNVIEGIRKQFPFVKLIWSQILPCEKGLNHFRAEVDDEMAEVVLDGGGHYLRYPPLSEMMDKNNYRISDKGEITVTEVAEMRISVILQGGIQSIMDRGLSIVPDLNNLPARVNSFIRRNINKFRSIKKKFFGKQPFYKKKWLY